ncbi:MAG: TonB family protein [Cytophagales bacterium]|nr:TonB family protein [Cytophagales bacterium]
MPTMPIPTLRNVDPYARTPAKLSKTGKSKTLLLVLALHLGLAWLLQMVWQNRAAIQSAPAVVVAQLLQEFRAPPPPQPPAPKVASPQPKPLLPLQAPMPPSQIQQALPAITTAPAPAVTANVPAQALADSAPHAPAAVASKAAPVAAAAVPAAAAVVVPAVVRGDSCDKPRYPPTSERLREEGVVSLKFLISENGQVVSGSVEKSSGYRRLDDAALAALRLCKFTPAMVDGKPRQEWSALRYRWELKDE